MEHNARESLFLRLSVEIQNKIYGYVLGGKIWSLGENRFGEDTRRIYRESPARDPGDRSREYNALLLVSRQIHQEAQLLPFELNTFDLGDLEVVDYMIEEFTAVQIGAIRRVSLGFDQFLRFYNSRLISEYELNSLSEQYGLFSELLPGLRSLHLYNSITRWFYRQDDQIAEDSDWRDAHEYFRSVKAWIAQSINEDVRLECDSLYAPPWWKR
ncbi:hypothetical protein EK21DRAFT_106854 [Setomelanomma holmii]|uniref:Uncharacterized protein n=1 Tax=Setomelanomma holmii TaxID=210430 RepID=A0A9P4HN54_9PLEO|nr:hypothetical protein EK21DRAFT_106854 [Setomelanomma holmii]